MFSFRRGCAHPRDFATLVSLGRPLAGFGHFHFPRNDISMLFFVLTARRPLMPLMSTSLPCRSLFRRRWMEYAICFPAAPLPSAAPRRISPTRLRRPEKRIPWLMLLPTFRSLLVGQLRVKKSAYRQWPRKRLPLSSVFGETRKTRRWTLR